MLGSLLCAVSLPVGSQFLKLVGRFPAMYRVGLLGRGEPAKRFLCLCRCDYPFEIHVSIPGRLKISIWMAWRYDTLAPKSQEQSQHGRNWPRIGTTSMHHYGSANRPAKSVVCIWLVPAFRMRLGTCPRNSRGNVPKSYPGTAQNFFVGHRIPPMHPAKDASSRTGGGAVFSAGLQPRLAVAKAKTVTDAPHSLTRGALSASVRRSPSTLPSHSLSHHSEPVLPLFVLNFYSRLLQHPGFDALVMNAQQVEGAHGVVLFGSR